MNRRARRAMMVGGAIFLLLLAINFMTSTPEAPPAATGGEGGEQPGGPGGQPGQPPGSSDVKEDELPVVMAQVNIPKQKKITADMIKMVNVPASIRHTDAATEVKQVLDRYSLVNVFAKEQILLQRLGESSSADVGMAYVISRGHRAISIPMTEDRAVGGYISPGKLVDIVGTFRQGTGMVTRAVLRRKKILAINEKYIIEKPGAAPAPKPEAAAPAPGKDGEPAKAEGFQQIANIQAITLEVTPEEGEKLILASQNSPLSLEIVHPDAIEERLDPVTKNQLELDFTQQGRTPAGQAPPGAPPQPQGPPPIQLVEIIRYKTKDSQAVALEAPTTGQAPQGATTGTGAPNAPAPGTPR